MSWSDLLRFPTSWVLVLGASGFINLGLSSLLGEVNRLEGKKDPGIPESLVPPLPLLAEMDLE